MPSDQILRVFRSGKNDLFFLY